MLDKVIINNKEFLEPNSVFSTATIHTKLLSDKIGNLEKGKAIICISDCKHSIMLWNDIDSENSRRQMLNKVNTLVSHLQNYRNELIDFFTNNKLDNGI